jgi:hypothetical protein
MCPGHFASELTACSSHVPLTVGTPSRSRRIGNFTVICIEFGLHTASVGA